jgi:hypothetical protein
MRSLTPLAPDPSTARRRLGARHAAAAFAAVTAAVALGGCAATGPDTSPAGTVERFVAESSVLGNGYLACTYLTPAEQAAVTAHAGEAETCRQALDAGGLVVGRDSVDSVHALHRLRVSTSMYGDRARVRVSSGRASDEFDVVRPRGVAERDEFEAPGTGWRISSGALALLHPPGQTTPRAQLTAVPATGVAR